MGGMNSGRWSHDNRKWRVEEMPCVDIRMLKKQSALRRHSSCVITHKDRGIPALYIYVWVYDSGLQLQTDDIEHVEFSESNCNYGGKRKWLLCPACRRRVVALYKYNKFRCRHCLDLTYESRNQHPLSRIFDKMNKHFERISDLKPDIFFIPIRRKGLHHKSYSHRLYEYKCLQMQAIKYIERKY